MPYPQPEGNEEQTAEQQPQTRYYDLLGLEADQRFLAEQQLVAQHHSDENL
jgi:hypothetical protein